MGRWIKDRLILVIGLTAIVLLLGIASWSVFEPPKPTAVASSDGAPKPATPPPAAAPSSAKQTAGAPANAKGGAA